MDLTITDKYIYEITLDQPIDPYDKKDIKSAYLEGTLPLYFLPGKRILLSTVDYVKIPIDAFGLIQLRSTWSRLGLISPPTVADPGFEGNLTMSLYNSSSNTILIHPNDKIWSLHFVQTYHYEKEYTGHYQKQRGITIAKPLILERA